MYDAITDVDGIEVGHAQDGQALTGCTVVLCRGGGTAGVDVRGLAPGTRETDLCRPSTLVERVHAVLLAGGAAFGLDAASGVMRYLWEQDIGMDVGVTRVPIVPAAVLFDLAIGTVAWPDDGMGYQACLRARSEGVAQGCVGAGTGATVGKLLGPEAATKSGIGTASRRVGPVTIGAIMAVNAVGDVVVPGMDVIVAGARDRESGQFINTARVLEEGMPAFGAGQNTTIGVVATDAALTVEQSNHLASVAHDGLARAIRPVHTVLDGDTIFCLATGKVLGDYRGSMLALASATADVVARAVVKAAAHATPAGGLPAGIPTVE